MQFELQNGKYADKPSDILEDCARTIYKEIQTNPNISFNVIFLAILRAANDSETMRFQILNHK